MKLMPVKSTLYASKIIFVDHFSVYHFIYFLFMAQIVHSLFGQVPIHEVK